MTMQHPKVLLTAPIETAGMALLEQFAEAIIAPDRDLGTIRQLAGDVDGIIACSPVPTDIFDHAPGLRGIVRHGAGYDIIPFREALDRNIAVAFVPGANAQSVAEYCIGAIFELARRYRTLDRVLREEGWEAARMSGAKPVELAGRRLGIIGVGAIGGKIAAIAAQGLAMDVMGYQRKLRTLPPFVRGTSLDNIFETADFIVLSCPLTPETRMMVNTERLSQMRPTSFLINISRGALIDENALASALTRKQIAGAALDVFIEEPLPASHPFLGIDSLLLTPHQAGASTESRARVSLIAVSEIRKILSGEAPDHPVLPE